MCCVVALLRISRSGLTRAKKRDKTGAAEDHQRAVGFTVIFFAVSAPA
jgi:hypothetical protein